MKKLVASLLMTMLSAGVLFADVPDYTLTLGTPTVNGDSSLTAPSLTVPYTLACDDASASNATANVYATYTAESTTLTATIAEGVSLNSSGSGTIANLAPETTYTVSLYAVVDSTQSESTASQSVAIPGPTTFVREPSVSQGYYSEFNFDCKPEPGLGTTTITVCYSLNSQDYANTNVYTREYGTIQSFQIDVPYTALSDVLYWKTITVNTIGSYSWTSTHSGAATLQAIDTERTYYTWSGRGDGTSWTDTNNWVSDRAVCKGYPGTQNGYYWSVLQVTESMAGQVIDMEGGAYAGLDDGMAMTVAANISAPVKFKNGTWGFNIYKSQSNPWVLGANGTTLVFEGVDFNRKPGKTGSDDRPYITFATGSTTIFEGTTRGTMWLYRPNKTYSNTKMIVRNGTLTLTQALIAGDLNNHKVWITNAVWKVTNTGTSSGIAATTYFRDGADSQAQFICSGGLKMNWTYDIEIPAGGHTKPSIQAKTLNNDTSAIRFNLDVTNWKKNGRVPLVKFTSTTKQTTYINQKTKTLYAYDNGKDVTKRRNAKLEWVAADNTLYYVQDYNEGTILFVY